jgi:hypothetical protein
MPVVAVYAANRDSLSFEVDESMEETVQPPGNPDETFLTARTQHIEGN